MNATGDNAFALNLYGQLRQRPGNSCFSPFSIRVAFGMAQAGARGATAAQMAKVLGAPTANGAPPIDADAISKRLRAAGRWGDELRVANSLWTQDGAPIRKEFLETITSRHHGNVRRVDFRRDAERARTDINRWVESQTKRKIRDLIPPGQLTSDTRLVLANAIYFKGSWILPFEKGKTRNEPFHVEAGGTVNAPLMRRKGDISYMRGEGFQAVDLGYRGGDLSMLILLPDRIEGLRDLEEKMSPRMLGDCVAALQAHEVNCLIPRFKFTLGTVDLRDPLAKSGMTLPFDRTAADFSGINGLRPPDFEALYVSFAFHKAFVEVNEEGTEAAAATGIGMALVMAPPPREPVEFRADHPFVFAIRDRRSGEILFLGRVVDPTREG